MMGMGFGFGVFGLLFMLLFWVGLIVLALWLISAIFPHSRDTASPADRDLSAREVLDRRYARGDITHDQYEVMKHDLISESAPIKKGIG